MTRYDLDADLLTLETILDEHLRVDDLKPLAALTRTGKEPLPARKAELAELIVRHLAGQGLRTVWDGLGELERAAVAEVAHSDSTRFHGDRFRAKYGGDPFRALVDEWGRMRQTSPLRLVFYGVPRCGIVMPVDLKERLAELVPPPRAAEIETAGELPAAWEQPVEHWNPQTKERRREIKRVPLAVRESERAAQRELAAVLRLVDAGQVAVSEKTLRPTGAAVAAVTAVLDGGDYYPHQPPKNKWADENAGPIRAFAWPLLVQGGGLAKPSSARLALTKAGREALAAPAAGALKRLWQRWLEAGSIDEFARIECVKGQQGKGKRGLTAASSRRCAITDALAACPPQRWMAVDELRRFMRASGRDFVVSRDTWHLYIGSAQYGSLGYAGSEGLLEGRYLLCFLLEYAATLGLIDVAYIAPAGARDDFGGLWGTDELPFFSRYDGLLYLRVNALGAYCLGRTEAYTPALLAAKPALRVLPNLEIAALGTELDHGDRLALDTYAVRQSDCVWRFEPAKLLEAIGTGRPVAEIREFLAARSAGPLPETVTRLLEDAAERSTRVRDCGQAQLLECADSALAALIANDARTRKHCLRAGERHLAVPAASGAAFRRALRELGYLLAPGGAPIAGPQARDAASGTDRQAAA